MALVNVSFMRPILSIIARLNQSIIVYASIVSYPLSFSKGERLGERILPAPAEAKADVAVLAIRVIVVHDAQEHAVRTV